MDLLSYVHSYLSQYKLLLFFKNAEKEAAFAKYRNTRETIHSLRLAIVSFIALFCHTLICWDIVKCVCVLHLSSFRGRICTECTDLYSHSYLYPGRPLFLLILILRVDFIFAVITFIPILVPFRELICSIFIIALEITSMVIPFFLGYAIFTLLLADNIKVWCYLCWAFLIDDIVIFVWKR